MKSLMKDALILFAITLLSGLILGSVYHITKEPIAKQQEKEQAEACKEVFEEAESFEEVNLETITNPNEVLSGLGVSNVTIDKVLKAKDGNGNAVGCVLSVISHEGYGGDISFYLGIASDGLVKGISILDIAETPGLGMKAEDVLKPQYADKYVTQFVVTKSGAQSESEIDAISGATITSDALTNAVNAGLLYFQSEWPKMNGGA